MLEHPGSGDAAVLVSLDFGDPDYAESLEELRRLTESAGFGILGVVGEAVQARCGVVRR